MDGTIRYERLGDDLREVVGDVELAGAYHDPIDLAEWYGDDRIRDLATAWGQADRLRFGYLAGGRSESSTSPTGHLAAHCRRQASSSFA